jgi:TIGR03009 family protein
MDTCRGLALLAMGWVVLCGSLAVGQGPAGLPQSPPGQPVLPQDPTLQRREPTYPAPAGPAAVPVQPPGPQVPFILSPEEMYQLDRVLNAWEQRNKEIKKWECSFTRWEYDSVFGNGKHAKNQDQGIIRYAAPDKGLFRIDGERSVEWKETAPGKGDWAWRKFVGERSEQWICDGKSIFEYRYQVSPGEKKRRIEHPLPPERQGKGISEGPLPFVFGTEAQKLKQRYFLRITTPADVQGEIWLEAYPRWQQDAADFRKIDVILKTNGLLPDAIQLTEPNGKDRKVYKFDDVKVNRRDSLFEGDWFKPPLPFGWKAEVDAPSVPVEANRAPSRR